MQSLLTDLIGKEWTIRSISKHRLRVDSEMQCYPHVINLNERLVMFYNGNGFGRTGIGYAEYVT